MHFSWEYLPNRIVYFPVYIWYTIQSIRFGSWGWVGASNPGLAYGGFVPISKRATLQYIPDTHKPKTLLRDGKEDTWERIRNEIETPSFTYPCIVKADCSQRSQKIYLAYSVEEIYAAHTRGWGPVLIQSYITEQEEFGITYFRTPDQPRGQILGIMHRQFATVEGNGKDTLATLIHKHARYRHYTPILQQHNQKQRDRIIPLGEVISIMPFGAHSRGTLFEDRSKYTTRAIEEQIDMIAQRIPGFYIGRFDIKAASLDNLQAGKFSVLEVNGVGGIPAHMYDPSYNLRQGWKILFSYWQNVAHLVKINKVKTAFIGGTDMWTIATKGCIIDPKV